MIALPRLGRELCVEADTKMGATDPSQAEHDRSTPKPIANAMSTEPLQVRVFLL